MLVLAAALGTEFCRPKKVNFWGSDVIKKKKNLSSDVIKKRNLSSDVIKKRKNLSSYVIKKRGKI